MFKLFSKFVTSGIGLWLDEGGGGGSGTDQPKTFDVWIETQPDDIKTLYSQHTTDLKTALEKEREANKEAKKNAKRLADLEAEEQKRKDAAKSEMDKLNDRAATAEAERDAAKAESAKAAEALNAERIKNAIIAEASKLGFTDPEDAYTLTDKSAVQIDDKNVISGAPEALKKLAEAKPYLLGKAVKGDGMGTPKGGTNTKKKDENPKRAPVIRSL